MLTESQKVERQRKLKEKKDSKLFDQLPVYTKRIIGAKIDRITVCRDDERLVNGGNALAVIYAVNEQIYIAQLELKSLLGLETNHE